MKKVILIIVMIILVGVVTAAPDIGVLVNNYNPETHLAKIQIQNNGDIEYHNVFVQIGDLPKEKVVDTMAGKAAIVRFKVLPVGKYVVKVFTDEGTFETTINILESVEEVKEEDKPITASQATQDKKYQEMLAAQQYKEKVLAQREESAGELIEIKVTAGVGEMPPEEVEEQPKPKGNYTTLIIYLILGILLIVFIIYFLMRGRKKEYEVTQV